MLSCQIEMCGTLLRIVKLLRKTLNLEIPLFKTKSMIVCYFSYLCGDVCGKLIKSFHGCSILRRRCLTSLILSFTTQWIGLLTVRGNSKNFTASGTFLSFLEIIAEKMNTWWVSLNFMYEYYSFYFYANRFYGSSVCWCRLESQMLLRNMGALFSLSSLSVLEK